MPGGQVGFTAVCAAPLDKALPMDLLSSVVMNTLNVDDLILTSQSPHALMWQGNCIPVALQVSCL